MPRNESISPFTLLLAIGRRNPQQLFLAETLEVGHPSHTLDFQRRMRIDHVQKTNAGVCSSPDKTGAVVSNSARLPKSAWECVTIMARCGWLVAKTPTKHPPSRSC